MAVTIGNVASSAQLVGANTEEQSYAATLTVSSGALVLVVHMLGLNSGVTAGTPVFDDASSVSAVQAKLSTEEGEHHLYAWRAWPTAGSRTVTVTQSTFARANLVLIEVLGADPSTPVGTPVTSVGNGNAPSVVVPDVTADDLALVLACIAGCDAGYTPIVPGITEGAGQAAHFERSANSAQGNYRDTYSAISSEGGTGSITMDYALTNAPTYALSGFRLIAAGAPPAAPPFRTYYARRSR